MIKKLLKIAVPIGIISYLVLQISNDWTQVYSNIQEINFFYLLLAIPFFLLIYPQGAFCWYLLLKKIGVSINFVESFKIWIISSTGRYIPGTIWQYLGRVEFAKRQAGIPRSQTIVSLMLEAFLTLLAGCFLGIYTVFFIDLQILSAKAWYLLLIPLLLIALHPQVLKRVLKKIGNTEVKLRFNDTLAVFPWFVINFLINGVALFFLVSSINHNLDYTQVLKLTSIYSISWVIGYLIFFAPGGIGVTEISLSYLLSFSMPLSIASVIALMYRFFLTVAEMIIFIFVLKIRKNG